MSASPNTTSGEAASRELILRSKRSGVTMLTMNMPRRLNGWTAAMMDALKAAFCDAAVDEETQVVILTGSDLSMMMIAAKDRSAFMRGLDLG